MVESCGCLGATVTQRVFVSWRRKDLERTLTVCQPGEPRQNAQAEKIPVEGEGAQHKNESAGNIWLQNPPFNPEVSMGQSLAAKQSGSLSLRD